MSKFALTTILTETSTKITAQLRVSVLTMAMEIVCLCVQTFMERFMVMDCCDGDVLFMRTNVYGEICGYGLL